MRKLATIRKIADIRPIENADAIECAVVDGWTVVVKKGEYKINDLAVYCEVDSFIPTTLAPFLSKGNEPREYNGVKGERLKTIRLRGQLSQGLLLPLAPTVIRPEADVVNFQHMEGSDVTDLLKIQKWEPAIPAQLAGEVRGMFPTAVPKTDQERVQNLVNDLKEWGTLQFEITEKLDGSSCTFYLDDAGELHVCSRNLDLKHDENNSFWKAAIANDVHGRMALAGLGQVAIQGELIGEGIQGNPYGIKGQEFYVYDMYDVRKGAYMGTTDRLRYVDMLGLKHVPIILNNALIHTDVNYLLNLAEGKSQLNPKTEREGLVFKEINGGTSFKAISNKFLLKTGG